MAGLQRIADERPQKPAHLNSNERVNDQPCPHQQAMAHHFGFGWILTERRDKSLTVSHADILVTVEM